jgi:two-component system, OmpR family, alkaline phosphatase synthesis response regulator PhoP
MDTPSHKILLVDDEPDILEFVGYNIRKEGYSVVTCSNGKDALELAQKELPQLIILDIMMPGMDGIETCIEMRKIPALKRTLIAFLTARSEDFSQIAGLDAGGDDYISKPVKPRVLMSRIHALLRRMPLAEGQEQQISVGDITADREKFVVLHRNEEHILPRKEFELLYLLISKPDKVFSRDEIFERIWGNDVIVGERTIDVHIRRIREKLGIENIKTIKGVGYKYATE